MRIDINTRKIVEETAGKQIVAEIAKVINAHWKSCPNLSRDNNQDGYAFPIQELAEFKKKSNEFWAKRIDNLLKYYKDNHVVLMEKDFEYTILMDEPDRNLDIDNIMDLYNVLSFHKPQTQIIAVIHNPALIYKLSRLDCVNFIEMTKGYLKKITGFMNKK